MRYLTILFVLLFLTTCQKGKKQSVAIGTWSKCYENGEYREFKITDKYMLMLSQDHEQVSLYNNKMENNSLIWSSMDPNYSLINDIDTLIIINQSKNKLILRSKFWKEDIVLNKIINEIKEIDSLKLETWKKETVSKFIKRSEIINCPDLRTEEEKILPDLGNLENYLEEGEFEIPMEIIKDSID